MTTQLIWDADEVKPTMSTWHREGTNPLALILGKYLELFESVANLTEIKHALAITYLVLMVLYKDYNLKRLVWQKELG